MPHKSHNRQAEKREAKRTPEPVGESDEEKAARIAELLAKDQKEEPVREPQEGETK